MSPLGHAQIYFVPSNILHLSTHSTVYTVVKHYFVSWSPLAIFWLFTVAEKDEGRQRYFLNTSFLSVILLKKIFSILLWLPRIWLLFMQLWCFAFMPRMQHTESPHPGLFSLGWKEFLCFLQWFHFCWDIVYVLRIALPCVPGVWEEGPGQLLCSFDSRDKGQLSTIC